MASSLRKLYHPSGLTGCISECPCGCSPIHKQKKTFKTAEQMGIRDTPAMRTIAELKRKARAAKPKVKKLGNPWKGATVSKGEIRLPDMENECTNNKCKKEHLFWGKGEGVCRAHPKMFKATVYTLGNAVAKVKVGKEKIIKR